MWAPFKAIQQQLAQHMTSSTLNLEQVCVGGRGEDRGWCMCRPLFQLSRAGIACITFVCDELERWYRLVVMPRLMYLALAAPWVSRSTCLPCALVCTAAGRPSPGSPAQHQHPPALPQRHQQLPPARLLRVPAVPVTWAAHWLQHHTQQGWCFHCSRRSSRRRTSSSGFLAVYSSCQSYSAGARD